MFHLHPSSTLQALFRERPYQGAPPENAKFIFVGLDANFDETVEAKPVFAEIVAYLRDGVAYWQSRGYHHPFLHPSYRGSGRRYHLHFAEIGFKQEHAPLVSFVELIDAPTFGQSLLELDDLEDEHIGRLEQWLFGGAGKHVFMFKKTHQLLRVFRNSADDCPPSPSKH